MRLKTDFMGEGHNCGSLKVLFCHAGSGVTQAENEFGLKQCYYDALSGAIMKYSLALSPVATAV